MTTPRKHGIIGHAGEKFTKLTELKARLEITNIMGLWEPHDYLVSGRSPMGGIDVWSEEEADSRGQSKIIFPAEVNFWDDRNGMRGFKSRNIQIAETSDDITVIVVAELPPDFRGMRHARCYHCARRVHTDAQLMDNFGYRPHVKSGACWTAWYAWDYFGKRFRWIVI